MTDSWREAYRGGRAIVTGGLGFIGSNLARELVDLGAEVVIVDSRIPDCGANPYNVADIASRIEDHAVDLNEGEALAPLLEGADWVFNLAGQVSHIDSMERPLEDLEINCRAQLSLLECCRRRRRAPRVIYAGTRQQYGRPQKLPVDESHPMNPTDINGINKMAGEWYHRLYHDVHALPTTSLRLTNTFGPRQLIRHPRQGFLSVFIRRVLEDQTIQVYGDGRQLRDYNYVSDVVRAFLMVAVHPAAIGQVYNLGSTEVFSVGQIAEMMVAIAGRSRIEVIPFPEERKQIDIGSYYGSFEKIRDEIGWEPRVSVEEGLRRTLEYYREQMEHYV